MVRASALFRPFRVCVFVSSRTQGDGSGPRALPWADLWLPLRGGWQRNSERGWRRGVGGAQLLSSNLNSFGPPSVTVAVSPLVAGLL
jgi:hypothetical protein